MKNEKSKPPLPEFIVVVEPTTVNLITGEVKEGVKKAIYSKDNADFNRSQQEKERSINGK